MTQSRLCPPRIGGLPLSIDAPFSPFKRLNPDTL